VIGFRGFGFGDFRPEIVRVGVHSIRTRILDGGYGREELALGACKSDSPNMISRYMDIEASSWRGRRPMIFTDVPHAARATLRFQVETRELALRRVNVDLPDVRHRRILSRAPPRTNRHDVPMFSQGDIVCARPEAFGCALDVALRVVGSTLTEIIALLDLLDDKNPDVVEAVRGRLEKLGEAALDALTEAAQGDDAKRRVRARAAVRTILARKATSTLSNYLGNDEIDLETAVLMLAETENPLLNREEIKSRLHDLAERVKARLETASGPLARSQCLAAVLAHEEGFSGNTQDYYDPSNSYIDFVLDRKVGIPISLAVLYVLVGRRAGLDVYGVSFPRHFVAGFAEKGWVTTSTPITTARTLTARPAKPCSRRRTCR
jgi:hypothetical protein